MDSGDRELVDGVFPDMDSSGRGFKVKGDPTLWLILWEFGFYGAEPGVAVFLDLH